MIRSCVLISLLFCGALSAQSAAPVSSDPKTQQSGSQPSARSPKPASAGTPVHFAPNGLPGRAHVYYSAIWGIDSLRVKAVESGELIRFSWRVLDPKKSAPLNDKKTNPLLLDSQAGVKLVIPTMEKVGQLRQSSTPEADKSYWMAFSNPGRRVKRGDFVSVVVGDFHAIGLVVE